MIVPLLAGPCRTDEADAAFDQTPRHQASRVGREPYSARMDSLLMDVKDVGR
ncbi:MAG: hypothetical protein U0Y68_07110 [Blastocatellia bacterium]